MPYKIKSTSVKNELGTIWFSEKEKIDIDSTSIPFLQHELIINFGDVFSLNNSKQEQSLLFSRIKPSLISTRVKGKYEALGVFLDPHKIYQIFGLSIAEFDAQFPLDVNSLFFNKKDEFLERLDSLNALEKINAFTSFFMENSMNRSCPKVVNELLVLLANTNFDYGLRLKKIAEDINFSSKHIITQFKDVIGITPKKYFQIKQINLVTQMMWNQPQKRLTQVALECGFYDQSHFIRTFKKITNLTPSQFRQRQLHNHIAFSNIILS